MRAKLIYEKFTEDYSDPIKDMGIGIFCHKDFDSEEEFHDFLAANIAYVLKLNEIPDVLIMTTSSFTHLVMKSYNVDKILNYINDYVTIKNKKIKGRNLFSMSMFAKKLKKGVRISTKEEIEYGKRILTEKFTQESDPIKDMGIGIKKLIIDKFKEALKINLHESGEFEIDEFSLYCGACLIKTNHPPWKELSLKRYLYDIFKEVELNKFLKKDLSATYYTHNIYWYVHFKEKYDDIFNIKYIIITPKNLND